MERKAHDLSLMKAYTKAMLAVVGSLLRRPSFASMPVMKTELRVALKSANFLDDAFLRTGKCDGDDVEAIRLVMIYSTIALMNGRNKVSAEDSKVLSRRVAKLLGPFNTQFKVQASKPMDMLIKEMTRMSQMFAEVRCEMNDYPTVDPTNTALVPTFRRQALALKHLSL